MSSAVKMLSFTDYCRLAVVFDPDLGPEDMKNNIHLISDPEGNSLFCFPESPGH